MKKTLTVLTLCVACITLFSGCDQIKKLISSDKEEKKKVSKPVLPPMPPAHVKVGNVDSTSRGADFDFIGYIEAINKIEIQPRISGYIEGILFEDGAYVMKDSPLVNIERTTYEAKVQIAQATLAQAEADLGYAQNNYQRNKQLFEKKAVAETTYDDAKRALAYNEAKVKEAKAKLDDAQNDLSYTVIKAPISGHIGRMQNYVGNYVTAQSAPIAEIIQTNPIYIRFAISEAKYQSFLFKASQNTEASIDSLMNCEIKLANGVTYTAKWKIGFTDNKIDNETGTIMIWLELENPKFILNDGGYVTITLSERYITPMPCVPIQAVLRDNQGAYVYTLKTATNDKGETTYIPERRNIVCGESKTTTQIINSGLNIGESIIIDGTHKVIPTMPVIPVK